MITTTTGKLLLDMIESAEKEVVGVHGQNPAKIKAKKVAPASAGAGWVLHIHAWSAFWFGDRDSSIARIAATSALIRQSCSCNVCRSRTAELKYPDTDRGFA